MILQLNPAIPVVTPKGKGIAHFLIDNGIESDLQWVCFQDSTGECWTWKNPDVRAQKNITHGRDYVSPFYDPKTVAFAHPDPNDPLDYYVEEGRLYAKYKSKPVSAFFYVDSSPPQEDKPCGCHDSEPVSQQAGETVQQQAGIRTSGDIQDFPGNLEYLWGNKWPEAGMFEFITQSGHSFLGNMKIDKITKVPTVIFPVEYDLKKHGEIKSWRQKSQWKQ